jgi:hypothetical protein
MTTDPQIPQQARVQFAPELDEAGLVTLTGPAKRVLHRRIARWGVINAARWGVINAARWGVINAARWGVINAARWGVLDWALRGVVHPLVGRRRSGL